MKKNNNYDMQYSKNPDTGRLIIDIALENYLEFFHEWDNSSFKKRDINPELAEFLDLCSEDIPLRKKLQIVFSLNTSDSSQEKEELITISYRNYYNSLMRSKRRKIKRYIKTSTISLLIALILLFTYGFLNNRRDNTVISKVFLESLLIGGWVFTWETIHLLFIDILEPIRRYREIKRFFEADIRFRYSNHEIR